MNRLEFKTPGIEEKELMEKYFNTYPTRSCERTFANVYLWCSYYKVTYAVIEDTLVFKSEEEEGTAFSFPAGTKENTKRAIELLIGYCKEKKIAFRMYNVTREQFEKLDTWYPDQYEIDYKREEADYIYETEKLIHLSGKKLHGKRNHINKFKEVHQNWSYETLSEQNKDQCIEMVYLWEKQNLCSEDEGKSEEVKVTVKALNMFQELGLKGGVLKLDGNVIAFTLGEEVKEDTFVIHIEKAFSQIQGAYPMINQQFASHECSSYQYINREEDLGKEGLRKAKLSYRPAFLEEKGMTFYKGEKEYDIRKNEKDGSGKFSDPCNV